MSAPRAATAHGLDDADRAFLARALDLARRAGRGTAPNPRVGAVVVKDGAVLGEGYHRRAGEAHAEVVALAGAGTGARGATLYTSLEPCAHRGRTPPCVSAIENAGIARVVVGMVDPDPQVAGRGLSRLREIGVAVDLAEEEAAEGALRVNEDYIVHRRLGRAFAALKVAATLDGRIADRDGQSQWITGPAARARGKALRETYGAIVVGSGTVLADDPLLMPPDGAGHPPFLRCVVDGRLRTPASARLLRAGRDGRDGGEGREGREGREGDASPVLIYTRPDADPAARSALERAGAEVVAPGPPGEPVPPGAVLADLARRGVLGALIEGGGTLHGAFLAAGCTDKLYWFAAPTVLGDTAARPAVDGGPRPLAAAFGWRLEVEERLEADILLTLYPASRDSGDQACSPGS